MVLPTTYYRQSVHQASCSSYDALTAEEEEGAAASGLSAEQRELLEIYQAAFDEDRVDHRLIARIVEEIQRTGEEGAVLVFLPGYDDIVTLRQATAILYS